jgi:hypothetical protein
VGQPDVNLPRIGGAVNQHTKIIVAYRAEAALNSRTEEVDQAYLFQVGQYVRELVLDNENLLL